MEFNSARILHFSSRLRAFAVPCLVLAFLTTAAFAQENFDPSFLQRLDEQSQWLYTQASQSVVRVRVPTTQPVLAATTQSDPLAKWSDRLSPDIRARLMAGTAFVGDFPPANSPAGAGFQTRPAPRFVVFNMIGLVIDAQGHAMLPTYVDKDWTCGRPMDVLLSDGSAAQARFVASDRKTHITVIVVDKPGLRPAMLLSQRPPEGALVMAIPVDPSQVHLGIWTRFADNWGLVVRSDGTVAGFSRHGYFLNAAACTPIVRQLIEYGFVQRPYLGVVVDGVPATDPMRQQNAMLGQQPAIRIVKVLSGWPAEQAGVKEGDLILDLGGMAVSDSASFGVAISERHGPTQLTILRGDRVISITVNLKD
ncbi:MAG TPA: PDZ domain-containing protein [Tepidisphaeraceae bacterium]|nr:PDZ domain-containing protein [Tepidisphaeraceae bacterium]